MKLYIYNRRNNFIKDEMDLGNISKENAQQMLKVIEFINQNDMIVWSNDEIQFIIAERLKAGTQFIEFEGRI